MSEYKVGVALMLKDGLSPALSALSHKLLGVHKSITEIENGMNRWKLAIAGAGLAFGGSALVKGVIGLVEHAKEFEHEMAKGRALGLSSIDMAKVAAQAWQNTRDVMGTSAAGAVNTIGSLYSIVGLDEALTLSKQFEQANRVLASVGKGAEGSAYIIARAGELMGQFTDPKSGHLDVARFSGFLDTIVKSVIATHGKVGANEWLAYGKQAGPAAGGLSPDGMLTTTAIIQAMGGFRAGTAAAAMAREFAGGIMSQRVAKELVHVGAAQEGDFEIGRGGQVIAKTGAMRELVDALRKDPLTAVNDILLPKLIKAGIDTNEKMIAEMYHIFSTAPAQRMGYELYRGRAQIEAERERAKLAMGVGGANANRSTDPMDVEKGARSAFNNMLTALGDGALKAAVPMMLELTGVFNRIAQLGTAHPEAVLNIIKLVAGIGVLLVVLGGAAVIAAAGTLGAIAAGIAALGLALTFVPWGKVAEQFNSFGSAIQFVIRTVSAAINPISTLAYWIGRLAASWIGGMFGGGKGGAPGKEGAPIPTNPYTKFPQGAHGLPHMPPSLGKQGYNAVPPPAGGGQAGQGGSIYMDGRKVGEIVSKHQSDAANGPLRGSAYYDGGATFVPADYTYARS
ncbi:MAG: hypothetical protein B7Y73_08515 [Acidocella sp. 35-58-6]|nr:MAG: hypothetical protein B7Y73_08515 [Acidocella sp. 35-58-6]